MKTFSPTQLPGEFHAVSMCVKLSIANFRAMYRPTLRCLTECTDDGKNNAVERERRTMAYENEIDDKWYGPATVNGITRPDIIHNNYECERLVGFNFY